MGQCNAVKSRANAPSLLPVALLLLNGPLIWAAHLLVIYGSTTVICAQNADPANVPVVIAIATIGALAALAITALHGWRRHALFGSERHARHFLRRVMLLLIAVSAVGTVWAGSTVLLLPACTSTV